MTLNAGTKLGVYEIVEPLGAGGMGEVYRARDSKLKREVAIKILPGAFSGDDGRIARFQREAEVLASLNHPNIAAIHDLAEINESRFLVLELVEGETLAAQISRGQIALDDALPIARQVAEALEAAHGTGITHRDLKPANIKLTPDGRVKVLDFGLAKINEVNGATPALSNSPKATGVADLYQKPAPGFAGSEELLLATSQRKIATDWSSDGRFILYQNADPKTGADLWALPLNGDRKPFPVVQTNFDERNGQFSPDRKWIAYESTKSGCSEIYVQPFPGPGGDLQVSSNGGAQVRWGRDGKELFYIALDDRLMAVPIRIASDAPAEAGTPVPLFATQIGGAVQVFAKQQYMVSPDGRRFLMYTVNEEPTTSPITVLLNWPPKP